MSAILFVYIIAINGAVEVKQQPASSIEVCMKAGELISHDVARHVHEVSFRCLPATSRNGGFELEDSE